MAQLFPFFVLVACSWQLAACFESSTNAPENSDNSSASMTGSWNAVANRTLSMVRRCLDTVNTTDCFRTKLLRALDIAIHDNGDWHLNEFVTLGRNPEYAAATGVPDPTAATAREQRKEEYDSVTGKLNELLRSRRVQFQTNLLPTNSHNEGRKKKNKYGGGMMIGGFAMAALYAQVVLGKITMLAAAAFVLAKIALLVATTSSLKKHVSTGGGTTEHIVYADHSSGHDGYRRNTFRSMGQYAADPPPYPYEASEELRDRDIRMADVLK